MFFIHDLLRRSKPIFPIPNWAGSAPHYLPARYWQSSSMQSNLFYGSGCHHINHWDAIETRSDLERFFLVRDHLPDRDLSAAR
jgi:hypothetical protein